MNDGKDRGCSANLACSTCSLHHTNCVQCVMPRSVHFLWVPSPAPSLAVEIALFACSEQHHVTLIDRPQRVVLVAIRKSAAEGRSEMWSLRGYCAACAFSVANMFFQSLLTRMLLCVSWSWQKRAWIGGTTHKSGHPNTPQRTRAKWSQLHCCSAWTSRRITKSMPMMVRGPLWQIWKAPESREARLESRICHVLSLSPSPSALVRGCVSVRPSP